MESVVIGRVVRLVGTAVELGLTVAEDALTVLSGLREAPRRRRLLLAVNILRGRPTAYRVDAVRPLGGGFQHAECSLRPNVADVYVAQQGEGWQYVGTGHVSF